MGKNYVYIFSIYVEQDSSLGHDDQKTYYQWIYERVQEYCEAIWLRVEEAEKFYLLTNTEDGKREKRLPFEFHVESGKFPPEAGARDFLDLIKKLSPEQFIHGDSINIAFISSSCSHWDYNFLKMSAYVSDSSGATIMGYYEPQDDLARQIYCEGDYDTGIEVNPDFPGYLGEEMMMTDTTTISRKDFEVKNYYLN